MFGTILGLFIGAGAIGHQINKSNVTRDSRNKAQAKANAGLNLSETYMDYDWNERDLKTGRKVYRRKLFNGDEVLQDEKGAVIKNYTVEKQDEKVAKAKEKGEKFAFLEYRTPGNLSGYTGEIYKGVEDGQLYTKVSIEWNTETKVGSKKINFDYRETIEQKKKHIIWSTFYLNLKTGFIVSCCNRDPKIKEISTDSKYTEWKWQAIDEFVEFFNEKQRNGTWRKYCCEQTGEYFDEKQGINNLIYIR